mgnify:CR=1 FL=1
MPCQRPWPLRGRAPASPADRTRRWGCAQQLDGRNDHRAHTEPGGFERNTAVSKPTGELADEVESTVDGASELADDVESTVDATSELADDVESTVDAASELADEVESTVDAASELADEVESTVEVVSEVAGASESAFEALTSTHLPFE